MLHFRLASCVLAAAVAGCTSYPGYVDQKIQQAVMQSEIDELQQDVIQGEIDELEHQQTARENSILK